jgi:histone H3/H4
VKLRQREPKLSEDKRNGKPSYTVQVIRRYQKSTDLLIHKVPFQRFVSSHKLLQIFYKANMPPAQRKCKRAAR